MPENNKKGIRRAFFTRKRRIQEKLYEALGKSEKSDDFDFEEKKASFLRLRIEIQDLLGSIKIYRDYVNEFLSHFSIVSVKALALHASDDAFLASTSSVESNLLPMVDSILADIIDSLKSKISFFIDMERKMKIRSALKVDYDAYHRKFIQSKEKHGTKNWDEGKYSKLFQKLIATTSSFNALNKEIYECFGYYHMVGGSIAKPEMEMFKRAQLLLFQRGAEIGSGLKIESPQEAMHQIDVAGNQGKNAINIPQFTFEKDEILKIDPKIHRRPSSMPNLAEFRDDSDISTGREESKSLTDEEAYWQGGMPRDSEFGPDTIKKLALDLNLDLEDHELKQLEKDNDPVPISRVPFGQKNNILNELNEKLDKDVADQRESLRNSMNERNSLLVPPDDLAKPNVPPPPLPPTRTTSVGTRPPIPPRSRARSVEDKWPKAKALFNFEAVDEGEMSLKEGDIVNVVREDDGSGWVLGKKAAPNGVIIEGLFPAGYISMI